MNYKMILNIIGKVFLIEAVLLVFPFVLSFIYAENIYLSYLIPMSGLLLVGSLLSLIRCEDKRIYVREGFVIVAFSWILLSVIGAVPFVISKSIPNYIDALFETVSGFTTTGSSILSDVEALPKSINFWRLFTHWIGGMGVLVFILTILPNNVGTIRLYQSESPGPNSSKLVSKLRFTARILYGIYFVLTVIEAVMLICGGMSVYDSVVHAMSTAGTGGFGVKNNSIAAYNSIYIEMVIAVFMVIFSINFNVFYFILIGQFKKALKCEEARVYLAIIIIATLIIAVNLLSQSYSFGDAMRYSFFQVTSISSTTGYASTNFDTWPALSKSIIFILMMIGACGGSTGGGIKVSRMSILFKSCVADVKKIIRPRAVFNVKYENEVLSDNMVNSVKTYFVIWCAIVSVSTIILSIDGYGDFLTNLTASVTCLGNVGPGFNLVGPTMNFGGFAWYSKILLSFVMLAGRLEIFPILILFSRHTWLKNIK